MTRILAFILTLSLSSFSSAAYLTFEEVGAIPSTGNTRFDVVGEFVFTTIRAPGSDAAYRGIRLIDMLDSPVSWADRLYNTPDNVALISFDIDTAMEHIDGSIFSIHGLFLGNTHFQSPILTFYAYLDDVLIETIAVTVPNIPSDVIGPSLGYIDLNLESIDRLTWNLSAYNIGTVAMDTISYTVVPLPAAIWLFLSAFFCLALVKRM